MRLMRLLAAGRSIMGIRKKPGPYRMSQENLLPRFAPAPAAVPKRRIFSRLTARLARLTRRKGGVPVEGGGGGQHIQTELLLDSVRVVRNDLSDSDFEVVPVRNPVAAES